MSQVVPGEGWNIPALRDVYPDRITLPGDEIVAFERAPQPSGFDPDDGIVLGEVRVPAEHFDRDRIAFDPVAAPLDGFLNNITEKRCGSTHTRKLGARDNAFELSADIPRFRRMSS